MLANLSVAKVSEAEPLAAKCTITDVFSGLANQRVTAGGVLRLADRQLRIAGDDPSVGIYLVSAAAPATRIKVAPDRILHNRPGSLELMVPASLENGQGYYLELVSQASSGHYLTKQPHVYARPTRLEAA